MKTDHAFHEIFRHHPDWLGPLLGHPLPPIREVRPAVFKSARVECDLLLLPHDETQPHYIVEFQLYYDASIFNRTELARCNQWKLLNNARACRRRDYTPHEVEAVILFGDERHLPQQPGPPHIRHFFLEPCVEALRLHEPESPMIPLLAPITTRASAELEAAAAGQYRAIRNHPALSPLDRTFFAQLYFHLLSQRFKDQTKPKIEIMIAELVPLEETRVGRDLIAKGRDEGRDELRKEIIERLSRLNKTPEEIAESTGFPIKEIRRVAGGRRGK